MGSGGTISSPRRHFLTFNSIYWKSYHARYLYHSNWWFGGSVAAPSETNGKSRWLGIQVIFKLTYYKTSLVCILGCTIILTFLIQLFPFFFLKRFGIYKPGQKLRKYNFSITYPLFACKFYQALKKLELVAEYPTW